MLCVCPHLSAVCIYTYFLPQESEARLMPSGKAALVLLRFAEVLLLKQPIIRKLKRITYDV